MAARVERAALSESAAFAAGRVLRPASTLLLHPVRTLRPMYLVLDIVMAFLGVRRTRVALAVLAAAVAVAAVGQFGPPAFDARKSTAEWLISELPGLPVEAPREDGFP